MSKLIMKVEIIFKCETKEVYKKRLKLLILLAVKKYLNQLKEE